MKTTKLNAEPAPEPPKVEGAPKPTVVSFALVKRDKMWHGVAIKSRGREILDERVLESDDYKLVAQDAIDRASHEFWAHGVDPFEEG